MHESAMWMDALCERKLAHCFLAFYHARFHSLKFLFSLPSLYVIHALDMNTAAAFIVIIVGVIFYCGHMTASMIVKRQSTALQ